MIPERESGVVMVPGEVKDLLRITLTSTERQKLDRLARSEGKRDTADWAKRILLSMTDLYDELP